MKRTSSSAKENGLRGSLSKLSARKKPLEHHLSALSSTQTCFSSSSQSILPVHSSASYRTLGSHNVIDWGRPESKQAYRKQGVRP